MTVKLVWVTPDAEKLIAYCARVSNPKNQDNPEFDRLLAYCIKHGHWSVFEMASMCVEINTSRAISRQILRHRSFNFQEFSTRYQEVTEEPIYVAARSQDLKNRQNSVENLDDATLYAWQEAQELLWEQAAKAYRSALDSGIAKECARALLPEGLTPTRMYMSGTVRSWIHYLDVRCDASTQLEHRLIAAQVRQLFVDMFPSISKAKGWSND